MAHFSPAFRSLLSRRAFPSFRAFPLLLALLPALPARETVHTVTAPAAVVAAAHPEAVAAGLAILRAGGNALDAAVTVSLALGAAEPYGSGLGGKLILLHFDAARGTVSAYDGMDAAGASFDAAAWSRLPSAARGTGPGSVAIPGCAAGLYLAHREGGGLLPWEQCVLPAAELAATGPAMLEEMVPMFTRRLTTLRGDPELARLYLPGGAVPRPGDQLPNPDLARTLRLLATAGPDGFYRGPVATALAAASARAEVPGFSEADLAAYRARLAAPLRLKQGPYTLYGGPPPTTGAALALLGLAAFSTQPWPDPASLQHPANLDRFGRLLQQLYPLIRENLGDHPDSVSFAQDKLAGPFPADLLRRALQADPALPYADRAAAFFPEGRLDPLPAAETTHFVIADRWGNLVSATQSLSLHWGSGLIAPGTGVVLNNSFSNFTTAAGPAFANAPAPGRRPRSTMAPIIVLRAGQPFLAAGLPGGQRIPSAMLQLLVERFQFKRALPAVVDGLRLHLRHNYSAEGPHNSWEFEADPPDDLEIPLRQDGWTIAIPSDAEYFGGINAIEILPSGARLGVADHRRTNDVGGY